MTLQDILFALTRPGRDPRDDLPPPMFRKGIIKLEDLEPGMELSGSVLNVVDFGVFVDIGLSDSGLVHISRLADRFVRDPHEVVAVGDQLRVWVVDVDKQRRRVSLTAIQPGTERPPAERPPRGHRSRPPKQSPPATAGQRGDKRRGADRKRAGGKPAPAARKAPSRPVTPITPEMVEGKEPMRSFADLLQYYEKKKPDGDEPAK
jgi:uncharacterized protein